MLTAILAQTAEKTLWMPEQASTVAPRVDNLFYGVLYLCIFFFALITILLIAFCIKYRHRKDGVVHESAAGHSTALELTWTIIPTILVFVIFYYGFVGFMGMHVAPPDSLEIGVRGKTWNWTYTYEDRYISTDGKLHIPVNKPVTFILSSDDVIHSFFIPAFRSKKDVVPGRYNRYWVQATKTGNFEITCAEYCGKGHSIMTSECVVDSPEDFAKFVEEIKDPYLTRSMLSVGQLFYETRGCATCHTVDGKNSTGPTFKDMFGSQVPILGNGNVLADENYIRESILYPQAKIVQGFPSPSPMPSFLGQFSDRDIESITAYMKSISVNNKSDLSKYKVLQPKKPATTQSAPPKPAAMADPHSPITNDFQIASSVTEVSKVWSSNHVR